MHNQKKDNNKFKNKKQPELTENKTVWNSDNQAVKEEAFIQTCRTGGDGQLGWSRLTARQWLEDWGGQGRGWWTRQLVDPARQQLAQRVRLWLVEQEVPHSFADKPGGTTGEQH